jgi:hypothetical protein
MAGLFVLSSVPGGGKVFGFIIKGIGKAAVAKTGVRAFDNFIASRAKIYADDAWKVLLTSKATARSADQLEEIARRGYIPANFLVKSIDNLGSEFPVVLDDAYKYANGRLRPAFRGLWGEAPANTKLALSTIDSRFELRPGQQGFDFIEQLGAGLDVSGSGPASVSFSSDFKTAVSYALRKGNRGVVVVYDKRLAPFVDSEATLKLLNDAMPDAPVQTRGGLETVKDVHDAAVLNAELSHLGRLEHVVGWFPVEKVGLDRGVVDRFVPNPKYVGNAGDWNHVTKSSLIETLQKENNIGDGRPWWFEDAP